MQIKVEEDVKKIKKNKIIKCENLHLSLRQNFGF